MTLSHKCVTNKRPSTILQYLKQVLVKISHKLFVQNETWSSPYNIENTKEKECPPHPSKRIILLCNEIHTIRWNSLLSVNFQQFIFTRSLLDKYEQNLSRSWTNRVTDSGLILGQLVLFRSNDLSSYPLQP